MDLLINIFLSLIEVKQLEYARELDKGKLIYINHIISLSTGPAFYIYTLPDL